MHRPILVGMIDKYINKMCKLKDNVMQNRNKRRDWKEEVPRCVVHFQTTACLKVFSPLSQQVQNPVLA